MSASRTWRALLVYAAIGAYLGAVFAKGEVISWFRIYEMFRFESFHMYGIIGSALAVASLSLQLIRWRKLKTVSGLPIVVPGKTMTPTGTRYWLGGTLFGTGWALVGACPGPMFALIGMGGTVFLAAALSAVAGTWVYGAVQARLPH
jgi:uncharacterized protein